jgi:hypothetical protein
MAAVALAVTAAISAAVFAACGDDNDSPGKGGGTTAAPSTAPAKAGTLEISGAFARETTNDVSAVYFTVKNAGAADRLTKASASVASRVELHETVRDGANAKMQPVAGIDIPATGVAKLEPGGYHVMLLGVSAPIRAGTTIDVELTFEKAGLVRLTVPVRSYSDESGMGGMKP